MSNQNPTRAEFEVKAIAAGSQSAACLRLLTARIAAGNLLHADFLAEEAVCWARTAMRYAIKADAEGRE